MMLRFRSLIRLTAVAALTAGAVAALAQAPATSDIRIVAPFPPGGPVDVLSRILANGLREKSGADRKSTRLNSSHRH